MSSESGPLLGGRYRIGAALGSGGMGTVYRAVDERLRRPVAIKLLRVADDERQLARFRQEARFLAGVHHPNLVTAFDAGADRMRDGSVVWLVMELVAGPDLGALLERWRRMGSEDVRIVLHDVAAALAALHDAGVLHRDLKPANVLLTAEPGDGPWSAKVADLGIARVEEAESLTTTGHVLGTAAYLSPEQVVGTALSAASDIYSLGLLALEALTGERAFPGSAAESATARLVRPPAIPAWIEGGWRTLLESMTAVDPHLRPTAAQVESATAAPLPVLVPAAAAPSSPSTAGEPTLAALPDTMVLGAEPATAVLTAEPPMTALDAASPVPRRRTIGIAAAALAAVALTGGALTLGAANRPAEPPTPSATARPTAHAVPAAVHSSTPPTLPAHPATTPSPKHTAVTVARPKPAPVRWTPPKGHGRKEHGKGHGKGHH